MNALPVHVLSQVRKLGFISDTSLLLLLSCEYLLKVPTSLHLYCIKNAKGKGLLCQEVNSSLVVVYKERLVGPLA